MEVEVARDYEGQIRAVGRKDVENRVRLDEVLLSHVDEVVGIPEHVMRRKEGYVECVTALHEVKLSRRSGRLFVVEKLGDVRSVWQCDLS